MCKKPVICRVNGMRVAGGQEIGLACDIAISSDLAIFGQAGPRHGSAPVGGSSDFLPWFLSMEDAMWNWYLMRDVVGIQDEGEKSHLQGCPCTER